MALTLQIHDCFACMAGKNGWLFGYVCKETTMSIECRHNMQPSTYTYLSTANFLARVNFQKRGAFTCVGWQLTPRDPIWQVTLSGCAMSFA